MTACTSISSNCRTPFISNALESLAVITMVVGGILLSMPISPAAGYATLAVGGGLALLLILTRCCSKPEQKPLSNDESLLSFPSSPVDTSTPIHPPPTNHKLEREFQLITHVYDAISRHDLTSPLAQRSMGDEMITHRNCPPMTAPTSEGTCFFADCSFKAPGQQLIIATLSPTQEMTCKQITLSDPKWNGISSSGIVTAAKAKLIFYPPFVTNFKGDVVGHVEAPSTPYQFPKSLFASEDGRILVARDEQSIYVFKRNEEDVWTQTSHIQRTADDEHYGLPNQQALSPDGAYLGLTLWSGRYPLPVSFKGIEIIAIESGISTRVMGKSTQKSKLRLESIAFTSATTLTIACKHEDDRRHHLRIYSWDCRKGQQLQTYYIQREICGVLCPDISLSPNGAQHFLYGTAHKDTSLHIFSFQLGENIETTHVASIHDYTTAWQLNPPKVAHNGECVALQFYQFHHPGQEGGATRLSLLELPRE